MKKGYTNNFDVLRLALSLVVVFYHIGSLTSNEFFLSFPGYLAVNCFFVVSGYLITSSFNRNRCLKKYISTRVKRIYPLYFVVILFSSIFGCFLSDLHFVSYMSTETIKYFISNVFFLNFIQPTLPGVFTDNGNLGVINGSLWTLKIEVMFYALVPLLFFNKLLWNKRYVIFIFSLSLLFYTLMSFVVKKYSLSPSLNNQLPSLLMFFMVGAYFNFINADDLRKSRVVLLFSCLLLLDYFYDFKVLDALISGMLVFIVVFFLPVIKISEKLGDISYGLYLWHYPVIQTLISIGAYENFHQGVVLTLISVFLLAVTSWHFLEKKIIR